MWYSFHSIIVSTQFLAGSKKLIFIPSFCSLCNDYNAHFPSSHRTSQSIQHIHLNSSWIRMKRKNFHEHILEWCFCSSSSSSHLVVDGKQIFFCFSAFHFSHTRVTFPLHLHVVSAQSEHQKKTERVCYDDFLFPMHVHEQFSAAAHPLCKLSEICWILRSADFLSGVMVWSSAVQRFEALEEWVENQI